MKQLQQIISKDGDVPEQKCLTVTAEGLMAFNGTEAVFMRRKLYGDNTLVGSLCKLSANVGSALNIIDSNAFFKLAAYMKAEEVVKLELQEDGANVKVVYGANGLSVIYIAVTKLDENADVLSIEWEDFSTVGASPKSVPIDDSWVKAISTFNAAGLEAFNHEPGITGYKGSLVYFDARSLSISSSTEEVSKAIQENEDFFCPLSLLSLGIEPVTWYLSKLVRTDGEDNAETNAVFLVGDIFQYMALTGGSSGLKEALPLEKAYNEAKNVKYNVNISGNRFAWKRLEVFVKGTVSLEVKNNKMFVSALGIKEDIGTVVMADTNFVVPYDIFHMWASMGRVHKIAVMEGGKWVFYCETQERVQFYSLASNFTVSKPLSGRTPDDDSAAKGSAENLMAFSSSEEKEGGELDPELGDLEEDDDKKDDEELPF